VSKFFSDLWVKIKADAINASALLGGMFSTFLAHIDDLAAELGDPNLTQQISTVVHADIKTMAHWAQIVSAIFLVARFKKLVQSPPKA
jgi:hypothetical protein